MLFRKNTKKCKSNSGFTLIELSVIMVVTSLIVVNFLTMNDGALVDKNAQKETSLKIIKIQSVIDKYYAEYNVYPCPADGSLPASNSSAGVSQIIPGGDCTMASGGAIGSHYTSGESALNASDEIYMGVIPFKTLGLKPDDAIDAWGRKISYAVSGVDTDAGTILVNPSSITVLAFFDTSENANAQDLLHKRTNTANASYVVISHGSDGVGAFTKNGSTQIIPRERTKFAAGVDAMNNEIDDSEYNDSIYQRINHHMPNYLDSNSSSEKAARVFIKPNRYLGQFVKFDDLLVFGSKS